MLYTAEFTYLRWNRSGLPMPNWSELHYDRAQSLDWWAEQLRALPSGVETVYGYMSNENDSTHILAGAGQCWAVSLPAS